MQIIQVYAPTKDYEDTDVENFYEDLENAVNRKECKQHIIMGDFNAKIGIKEKNENLKWIGPHGIGIRNDRGERLLDFAANNKLLVTNTFFEKPASRYWTWESPGGAYHNQIDFILADEKSTIYNTEVITHVDIGSDHRMVRGKVKINKRLLRLKRIKRKHVFKIDIKGLEKATTMFQLSLHNRFDALKEEPSSIETLNKTIRETAKEVCEERQRERKEQNAQNKEFEELETRRKMLRKRDNKSTTEKIEYAELNKTVKKKRRTRARRKRKEFITKILEMKRGPKETRKDGCKKKISSMKDKNGERITDREEILNICKKYYEELYDKSVQDPDHLLSSSPDNTEVPPFTEEEVEASLKKMSKRKAPGPDDITSDMFILGGEPVLKYLTKTFNEILTTTQIPPSWDEAKVIIIYKKGDPGDTKNYRPISLLSHSYKLFTRLLQTRMENILDQNQPGDQAGFRRKFSTIDHIYTLNQIIEKTNEYNLPLCVGLIDNEKAFDSVKHFAIFEALRKININETYVQILENIYKKATASIHMDDLVSEKFQIKRGVRQGDPISPKLFSAAIETIFQTVDVDNGLNIYGEILTNL